jgi:hypothetical protein
MMPVPWVISPPAIEMRRADPPGLILSATAGSFTTTPLTKELPVPPHVSIPRRTIITDRLADLNSHSTVRVTDDTSYGLALAGISAAQIAASNAR